MQKDIAVKLQNISKMYSLYDKPLDRLKEVLHPFKKEYHKDFYALKDINLEIRKGEVLGIVGINGAGKSTLLKIISGVMSQTTGRVNIHGRINAILELGSGLKPEMTGKENIKLNLQLNGIDQDQERITQEVIDFADIGAHINQPIKTYSSGMKARLGFGIATSTDPDILIVDEVLAVGDVIFQRKCYARVEKLFKDGKTVIFVSHSAQSVIEFCSRAILLYDRKIILDDTPKKVTDYYQKLVFSKNTNKVLNEIKNKKQDANLRAEIIQNNIQVDNNFYLEGLKAKQIEYRNYDVDIYDVKIINDLGLQVNILEYGIKYYYQYKVKYNLSIEKISNGMQIKSKKGLTISATSLHQLENLIERVKENDIYQVSFEFTNRLLPGIYLTNAGVSFLENEERIFLNRIIDAYCFEVRGGDGKYGGIVGLDQKVQLKKL